MEKSWFCNGFYIIILVGVWVVCDDLVCNLQFVQRSLASSPITSPYDHTPMTIPGKTKNIFFFENFRNIFGWGALPPRPPNFWLGGQSPPRPPLNGRSSHLIEAAKRGRLDQMFFFFGAADDTRTADDRAINKKNEKSVVRKVGFC